MKQGATITAHGYPKRDGTKEMRAEWMRSTASATSCAEPGWMPLADAARIGLRHFCAQLRLPLPAANVLHVVGVISFFGLVATMDLALLGAMGRTPANR